MGNIIAELESKTSVITKEGMKLRDCMEHLRELKSAEAGDCKFEEGVHRCHYEEKFVAIQNHLELDSLPKTANERV